MPASKTASGGFGVVLGEHERVGEGEIHGCGVWDFVGVGWRGCMAR